MSRLMREELEHQKKGGALQRFFNKPVVLVTLFIITVALIVWAFLPASAEALYQRGAALMQSSDTGDWDRGIELLDEMVKKEPNHQHQAEMAEFRKQYDG